MFAVYQHVDARREHEERLREHVHMRQAILDGIPAPVFFKDTRGVYLGCNEAFCAYVGRTREQLVGKTVHELWAKDLADVYHAADLRLLESRSVEVYEASVRYADGSLHDVVFHKGVFFLHDGSLGGQVGTILDITNRKRAEQALRASEERYRMLFETASEAILVLRGLTVLETNKRALEMFGGTREEIVGRSVAELSSPTQPDGVPAAAGVQQRLAAAHRSGVQVFEWAHQRCDGSDFDAEISLAVLDADADVYIGLVRDVTERRRAREALERVNVELEQRVAERTAELCSAYAALQRAAHAKDEFLASMSHELRTPLNAVLGLSESLQSGIYGPIPERGLKMLKRIEESGRHLLSLINDILDLSKLEAEEGHLELGAVSVGEVCRASLALVQQDAIKRRHVVSLRMSDASIVLEADARRLKQILVNLLSNAVKFTPEGGALGLDVGPVNQAGEVEFTVWDTGIGISPEEIPRLFRPFVQLDSSLSRQHAGTGLGLSLVRKLAQLHGGSVRVESELSRGSRFTLVLPARAGSAHPRA